MNSDRIKAIQSLTPYPNSVSVHQALLQVWNECEQQHNAIIKAKDKEIKNLHAVINARDLEDKELFEGTHEALEGLTIRGEK